MKSSWQVKSKTKVVDMNETWKRISGANHQFLMPENMGFNSYFKPKPPKIPRLFAISAAISDIQPHLRGMLDSDDSASWGNFPGVRRWCPGAGAVVPILCSMFHVWNRFSQILHGIYHIFVQAKCMGKYSRHGASGFVTKPSSCSVTIVTGNHHILYSCKCIIEASSSSFSSSLGWGAESKNKKVPRVRAARIALNLIFCMQRWVNCSDSQFLWETTPGASVIYFWLALEGYVHHL